MDGLMRGHDGRVVVEFRDLLPDHAAALLARVEAQDMLALCLLLPAVVFCLFALVKAMRAK